MTKVRRHFDGIHGNPYPGMDPESRSICCPQDLEWTPHHASGSSDDAEAVTIPWLPRASAGWQRLKEETRANVRPHGGRLQLQQTGSYKIHDGLGSEVERICLHSTARTTARKACPINYDYLVFRLTSSFPTSPITTLPACLGWQALHGC